MHKKRPSRWYVWRSAITGRFVKMAYALRHPKTTIKQLVRRKDA